MPLWKLDDSFLLKQTCAVGVGLNCEGTSGESGALHMGEPQLNNNASCDYCAVFFEAGRQAPGNNGVLITGELEASQVQHTS